MDLSAYFLTLEYIIMGLTFVALALIFLYSYYGKDDEKKKLKLIQNLLLYVPLMIISFLIFF